MLIIKNGTVVNVDQQITNCDIKIEKGKIVEVGQNLKSQGHREIDATACMVYPGGIDPHVHLHLEVSGTASSDDFETGSLAALSGGTTSLIDFVTPNRGQSMLDALFKREKQVKNCRTSLRFHMGVTSWNDKSFDEMKACMQKGIMSFKTFFAYLQTIGIGDREFLKALKASKELGALITLHAENGELVEYRRELLKNEGKLSPRFHPLSRPSEVEDEAAARAMLMAEAVGCPLYIVHTSSAGVIEVAQKFRARGNKVFIETCPQYLFLDDSVYEQDFIESAAFVMSPPIRPKGHQEKLIEAMGQGLIDTVGTDHCPFSAAQKKVGENDFTIIPNGAGGIEHRLLLLHSELVQTGKITPKQFVAQTSYNTAQIFKWKGKGELRPGFDADIVVVDPQVKTIITAQTQMQKNDQSIFEGKVLNAQVRTVILNGEVV